MAWLLGVLYTLGRLASSPAVGLAATSDDTIDTLEVATWTLRS